VRRDGKLALPVSKKDGPIPKQMAAISADSISNLGEDQTCNPAIKWKEEIGNGRGGEGREGTENGTPAAEGRKNETPMGKV
jgi:hypothetical protein